MDFKTVLYRLLTAFHEHNIRYGLMGGFAMGLWGGSRSTVDLDFLVQREDMGKVHAIMTGIGYELHYRSDNVSQYASPLKVFGGVDFIHAFREASIQMLERAQGKDIFGGELKIRTLVPEDIIGLKLQAIANNPAREKTDMADIENLLAAHSDMLDSALLQKYFALFNMEDLYKKMMRGTEE